MSCTALYSKSYPSADRALLAVIKLSEENMLSLVDLTADDHARSKVAFGEYDRCRESLQISSQRKASIDSKTKIISTFVSTCTFAYLAWLYFKNKSSSNTLIGRSAHISATLLRTLPNHLNFHLNAGSPHSSFVANIPHFLVRMGFLKCASVLLGFTVFGSKLMNVSHKYSQSLKDRALSCVQTAQFHSQAHAELLNAEHTFQMSLLTAATKSLKNRHERILEIWRSVVSSKK